MKGDRNEMKEYLTKYIGDRVELLLFLFDEQITVLTQYEYVDTDLIERIWDSQIKKMAQHMGVSTDSYELIEWYFLDGHIVVEDDRVIEDKEGLIEYLVDRAIEKQKELNF